MVILVFGDIEDNKYKPLLKAMYLRLLVKIYWYKNFKYNSIIENVE